MKVFLDTNVLVSALATRGLCADVLREVLGSHQLVISPPVLTELKRVLRQKLRVPSKLVTEAVEIFEQDAHLAIPTELPDVPLRDKDDLVILSSALNGKADLFVTGDEELLRLARIEKLEIVSPRDFWERVKAQRSRRRGKS